jgi:uncharacterized protein (TIGR03118 family)
MWNKQISKRAALAGAILAVAAGRAGAEDDDAQPGWSHHFYDSHVLVSDGSTTSDVVDANLVNAWGVAFNPQAVVWIADNHTGKATLYDGTGKANALVVAIPPAPGEDAGSPTGIVFSGGSDFVVNGTTAQNTKASGPARFIFASEGGQITGWAPNVNTAMTFVAVDNSAQGGPGRAIYKGIALGGNGTTHLLYATDFHNARVDVFDGTFKPASLPAGAFADPAIPKGFAPFGIQAINGDIVVTYAKQDGDAVDDVHGRGLGFVDVFDPNGTLVQRLSDHIVLNAPWGTALAPASFGRFGGALLIGNFGDGTINAFSPVTGQFIGALRDARGRRITIDGLWGMQFGNGLLSQETNALYAAAGPGGEEHGTYNVIHAH